LRYLGGSGFVLATSLLVRSALCRLGVAGGLSHPCGESDGVVGGVPPHLAFAALPIALFLLILLPQCRFKCVRLEKG